MYVCVSVCLSVRISHQGKQVFVLNDESNVLPSELSDHSVVCWGYVGLRGQHLIVVPVPGAIPQSLGTGHTGDLGGERERERERDIPSQLMHCQLSLDLRESNCSSGRSLLLARWLGNIPSPLLLSIAPQTAAGEGCPELWSCHTAGREGGGDMCMCVCVWGGGGGGGRCDLGK